MMATANPSDENTQVNDNWKDMRHCEIIVQLGYNSGHIGNPFSPLFYPPRSEHPALFHLMWPRIHKQKILDPLWGAHF